MTSLPLLPLAHPAADRTDPAPLPEFLVSPDRIDLWLVRRPAGPDAEALDRSELDPAERTRADSFIRQPDGLLYASAHVALRRLLGRYTDTAAENVRFLREPCPGCGEAHGRPAVAQATPPLHFSLSHSGGVALVGVAAVPIGVDVERLPGEETVEICSKAIHPDEQAELAAVEPGEERRQLFGRIWTRKEAFLKGLGTGLSRPLTQDYLGADADRHPAGWTMVDIPCDATHAASAAVRGPAPAVVNVRWVPDQWLQAAPAPGTTAIPGKLPLPRPAPAALAC